MGCALSAPSPIQAAAAPQQQTHRDIQPAVQPKASLDEDETKAKRLFSACLARDKWVDALSGNVPWHAERASALTGSRTSGGTERVHVHRSCGEGDGALSCFVATILSSPHSPPGEVLWQVDAREKTISAFGEPGYGGLLLGSKTCVMLVDQSDGATVLYFYVGERVALRCWRRTVSSTDGGRSSDGKSSSSDGKSSNTSSSQNCGQRSEEDLKRRERRREKRQQQQQHEQNGRSRRSEGERGSSSSGGDKASSEKKKRRRSSHDDASSSGGRRRGGNGSSGSSSSTIGSSGGSGSSSSAAAGELPGVAAWARGKDLAACLCDLSGAFGHALPDAALPRPSNAEALRKSPAALRKAYHKALLAVHPDKHVSSTPERQSLCVALFVVLSAAHAAAAAREGEQQQAC